MELIDLDSLKIVDTVNLGFTPLGIVFIEDKDLLTYLHGMKTSCITMIPIHGNESVLSRLGQPHLESSMTKKKPDYCL